MCEILRLMIGVVMLLVYSSAAIQSWWWIGGGGEWTEHILGLAPDKNPIDLQAT